MYILYIHFCFTDVLSQRLQ